MGLDTSHNAWHGPCTSFNEWRRWLAKQIGIDLNDYTGYAKSETGEYIEGKDLATIEHDIQPLLDHSDCDGDLSPEQCYRIANGLEDILKKTKSLKVFVDGLHRASAVRFRNGCLLAAHNNERLDFH